MQFSAFRQALLIDVFCVEAQIGLDVEGKSSFH